MDPNKERAQELMRRAYESQKIQESSSSTTSVGFISDQWNKADRERKTLYCVVAAATLILVIVTPILAIRYLLSSDSADGQLVKSISGDHRLDFSYTWIDLNGKEDPRRDLSTTKTHLVAEHSREGWKVEFFGKEWTGATDELADMSIFCPFDDVIDRLSGDLDFGTAGRSLPANAGLTLSVMDGTFQIQGTGLPYSRRSQGEQNYSVTSSGGRPPRTSGTPPPPDAKIISRYSNTDNFGNTETNVRYTVSAMAGFRDFSCTPVSLRD